VKRILSALAGAASIAALALGAAGTANADVEAQQARPSLYIAEVSTGPGLQEYVKIAVSGAPVTLPYSVNVKATFGGQSFTLATIPALTTLEPGMVYTIAHAFSGVGCANQFYSVDLPDNLLIQVEAFQTTVPSNILDAGSIPQIFPLPPLQSWHRASLTPSAFTPQQKAPCAPPTVIPPTS
jgi:hypothetical protein